MVFVFTHYKANHRSVTLTLTFTINVHTLNVFNIFFLFKLSNRVKSSNREGLSGTSGRSSAAGSGPVDATPLQHAFVFMTKAKFSRQIYALSLSFPPALSATWAVHLEDGTDFPLSALSFSPTCIFSSGSNRAFSVPAAWALSQGCLCAAVLPHGKLS